MRTSLREPSRSSRRIEVRERIEMPNPAIRASLMASVLPSSMLTRRSFSGLWPLRVSNLLNERSVPEPPSRGYEPLLAELLHINRLETSPRMGLRDRQDHLILPDLLEGEPPVSTLEADEPDFHLPIENSLDDPGRITDAQDRLDFRIFLSEGGK